MGRRGPRRPTARRYTRRWKMNRYIKYTDKIDFKQGGFFTNFISKVFPKPDPDFDSKFEHIDIWYLEIEPKYGLAHREIGLSKSREPIVFGPFKSYRGLWIDSLVKFNADDFENISKDEFEKNWSEIEAKYK